MKCREKKHHVSASGYKLIKNIVTFLNFVMLVVFVSFINFVISFLIVNNDSFPCLTCVHNFVLLKRPSEIA